MKKASQAGFAAVELLLTLILIAIIGFTGYYVWHSQKQTDKALHVASDTSQKVAPKATTKTSAQSTSTVAKALADSPTPAAGTCAKPSTQVVSVELDSDIPNPRCTQVSASQTLSLQNATSQAVTATLGSESVKVQPGGTATINKAFGDYLEPGDHIVRTGLYGTSGPEIYLVEN